jgi:hypothetical protein
MKQIGKPDLERHTKPGQPDLVTQIIQFCIHHKISDAERQKMMTVLAEGKAESLTQALTIVRG